MSCSTMPSLASIRTIATSEHGVDRVPRRPRRLRNDRPLLAQQGVQEARLADVRTSEDRDADRILLGRHRCAFARRVLEVTEDEVEQVARAVAVERGERERVAEPET